jgi:4a-hydroxytetrahydrobiopterin dehydratase
MSFANHATHLEKGIYMDACSISDLLQKKCRPCSEGETPIKGQKLAEMMANVPQWRAIDEQRIEREFKFPNFSKAWEFVNRVCELAQEENHHPWIHFTWGLVRIELWTHKINGLSENDFIMAAKIDHLP